MTCNNMKLPVATPLEIKIKFNFDACTLFPYNIYFLKLSRDFSYLSRLLFNKQN